MKPWVLIKTNKIIMMTFINSFYLFYMVHIGSPVGGWGLWTKGIILEPNESDHHRGHSYTIWVIKMGILLMHIMKHIWPTSISTEQYLQEQMKKATGQLGNVFMQVSEVNGPLKLQNSDCRMEITLGQTQTCDEKGVNKGSTPSI